MEELTRINLIANKNQIISPTLQCGICLDLVMDPVECENCSKLFCNECINGWLQNSNQCPNKHIFKNAQFLDEWINNSLLKIYLICPNCNSPYNYNYWENHLKVCENKSNDTQQFTPSGKEVFEWVNIQFFVKDLHNKNHIFNLPISTLVKELKEKLKDKTGISVEDMILTCGPKIMQNEKMLEFYSVYNNTTITQLTRLKGGCQHFIN